MREFKFRGKSNNEKGWIYGDLVRHIKGMIAIVPAWNDDYQCCGSYEVDPDTIGQYIGLKDKNGKEIYEGDILRMLNNDTDEAWVTTVRRYGEVDFCTCDYDYTLLEWIEDDIDLEIIGNIYDNPELLKEE